MIEVNKMTLPLMHQDSLSKSGQIKQFLINKIMRKELPPHSRIYSIKELSQLFDVNKNTAVKVLNELASEKYIYQERGKGSFVAELKRRPRTANIGILVHNIGSPIFFKIIKEIDDVCREHSYNLIPCSTYASWDREQHILNDFMTAGKIDGLVVFPCSGTEDEMKSLVHIHETGIPVMVHVPPIGSSSCSLTTMEFDYEKGIVKSVEHLLEQGYRKIGLVNGAYQSLHIMQRFYGYRMALDKAGIPFRQDYVFPVDDLEEKYGYQTADRFIDHPDRPDALVVASDEVAIGLINRMHERNLRVPHDVAITAGGNTDTGAHPIYSLTTIAPDYSAVGRMITERMMQMIENPKCPPANLCFHQDLIVRKSSMPSLG